MPLVKTNNLRIEKITSEIDIPFDLLLLADETLEAINRYVHDSDIYIAKQDGAIYPIAVFVLQLISPGEMEIKNIAVANILQGNGIGSWLIEAIKEIVKQNACTTLWVGTPDSATKEIKFYEKNGFRKAGLKQHFFTDNYAEPIYNDGVLLSDMLMLKTDV